MTLTDRVPELGVAEALLRAVNRLDRRQPRVAILLLRVFEREVKTLSVRFIEPAHAAHTVEHAQSVIQALQR